MLKIEKASNKADKTEDSGKPVEEYTPQDASIDIHSSNASIVTDMSNNEKSVDGKYDMQDSGFKDDFDDEFEDYSRFARGGKAKNYPPIDFDLDGEFADDLEYIPDSPDFSYLHHRKKKEKKPLNKSLNELPDEIKAIMLSDVLDRKFFD